MNVSNVGVIGAGTMGAGIAQVAATAGCAVQLLDTDPNVVRDAIQKIGAFLNRSVEKGKLSPHQRDRAVANLHPATDYESLARCGLVIEAIVEDLDIKQKVFARLESACLPDCLFATNTSSLSVTKLSETLNDPARLVGMHFFNPAPLMPLVEIIAGQHSRPDAVDLAFDTAAAWNKSPVRAKDSPGFIVNRVARPFYLEALRILGDRLADVPTIDRVMRDLGGFRMGPFQLMDLVGIDVNFAVSQSVYEQFGRPARLTPHPIQAQLLAERHLGRKTNRGFYDYSADQPTVAFKLAASLTHLPPDAEEPVTHFAERAGVSAQLAELYIFARILTAVFNEAHLALEQQIASPEHIDRAMRKGTNYPQGPLAWSRTIGYDAAREAFVATRGNLAYDAASIAAVLR